MKVFTKEVKIALVAIVGIVVLFFGMNFLKGLDLFSSTDDYFIEFKDISGLSSSSPIYADGYQVGTVKSVIYDYTNEKAPKVVVAIDKAMRIPEGSSAEIVSDMMGNVKVNLLLANNMRSRVMPGQTIHGDASSGVMSQVSALLPAVQAMLPKLDSILASVNALLADPALANSLHNVETITQNLSTSSAELNKLMASMNNGVPTMMTKANRVLDNADELTGNLASLDLASTKQQIDNTLANVQQLTDKLNKPDGTLGLLMNDASLYNNLSSTMRDADSLLVNLRQHPKRYVHFSLFGKKDK
jgi:phospholipid/cholesterol/gamma-HCH transport system substrate-binding protein